MLLDYPSIKKVLIRCFRWIITSFRYFFSYWFPSNKPILLVGQLLENELSEIKKRFFYYLPQIPFDTIEIQASIPINDLLGTRPILLFGETTREFNWITQIMDGVYDIDYHHNPFDALSWCDLAKQFTTEKSHLSDAKTRFTKIALNLNTKGHKKCYVFGTGPSLEKAILRDWSDGYRIVCNTIVRDQSLWEHVDPNFFVAADANYHFGHTEYASRFRSDLRNCLRLTTTTFIYPARFDVIVKREFAEFEDRLIPIPSGIHRKIHIDLTEHFRTPALGNVLLLLLLPLACTLSRNVYLWGFDGRSPNDKLFWSNSPKHSYPELIPSLQAAYPAFFKHYVPANDQEKYVRQFHGDALDKMMNAAEKDGFSFIMMHPSWTSTLMKRYDPNGEKVV